MPKPRPWRPSLRCDRCRAVRPLDALLAWLGQPVGRDGGRVHFVCRRCKDAARAR